MINFNTDRIVILHYPSYAGGKFLSNCLSLSKHAVSQCPFAAEVELGQIDLTIHKIEYNKFAGADWPPYEKFFNYDLADVPEFIIKEFYSMNPNLIRMVERRKKFQELSYYEFKLYVALDSLPPQKNLLHKWLSYEYGCDKFFGFNPKQYTTMSTEKIKQLNFNNIIDTLSNSGQHFFLVSHSDDFLQHYQKVWPNAKIILLENYAKFRKIAMNLKKGNANTLSNFQCNFTGPAIKFNVDDTFFDEYKFSDSMRNLYKELGFDDFNSEVTEVFRSAYMKLHSY